MNYGPETLSPEPHRSSAEILQDVGLTPESLHGKTTLFFGRESLAVEGATISAGDTEAFLTFGQLVPEEGTVDHVIGVGESDLQVDLDNPDRLDLLEAAIRAIKDTGEVRVAMPISDPEDLEGREAIADDTAWMLYDRGLDVTTQYVAEEGKPSYIIIKPQ